MTHNNNEKKPLNRVSVASFILSAAAVLVVAMAVVFDLPAFILVIVPIAALLGLVLGVVSLFVAGFGHERGVVFSVLAILLCAFLVWRAFFWLPG